MHLGPWFQCKPDQRRVEEYWLSNMEGWQKLDFASFRFITFIRFRLIDLALLLPILISLRLSSASSKPKPNNRYIYIWKLIQLHFRVGLYMEKKYYSTTGNYVNGNY